MTSETELLQTSDQRLSRRPEVKPVPESNHFLFQVKVEKRTQKTCLNRNHLLFSFPTEESAPEQIGITWPVLDARGNYYQIFPAPSASYIVA